MQAPRDHIMGQLGKSHHAWRRGPQCCFEEGGASAGVIMGNYTYSVNNHFCDDSTSLLECDAFFGLFFFFLPSQQINPARNERRRQRRANRGRSTAHGHGFDADRRKEVV